MIGKLETERQEWSLEKPNTLLTPTSFQGSRPCTLTRQKKIVPSQSKSCPWNTDWDREDSFLCTSPPKPIFLLTISLYGGCLQTGLMQFS